MPRALDHMERRRPACPLPSCTDESSPIPLHAPPTPVQCLHRLPGSSAARFPLGHPGISGYGARQVGASHVPRRCNGFVGRVLLHRSHAHLDLGSISRRKHLLVGSGAHGQAVAKPPAATLDSGTIDSLVHYRPPSVLPSQRACRLVTAEQIDGMDSTRELIGLIQIDLLMLPPCEIIRLWVSKKQKSKRPSWRSPKPARKWRSRE
jgi:hypothetical protein